MMKRTEPLRLYRQYKRCKTGVDLEYELKRTATHKPTDRALRTIGLFWETDGACSPG